MSVAMPESVDAWRMIASRRIFEGSLPLAAFPRLLPSLADERGDCAYRVEFGKDEFGVAFCDIRAEASLPLVCQRTLERFELPVLVEQRVGLVRDEREEAGLPPGYEPVQMPEDGRLAPAELIEDELILAVPVVPVKPGSEAVEAHWAGTDPVEEEAEEERPNPFAALSALKSGVPKPGKPS
jgi:uncharacterized protein